MPLGGLLIALFVGWHVARPVLDKALAMRSKAAVGLWLLCCGFCHRWRFTDICAGVGFVETTWFGCGLS